MLAGLLLVDRVGRRPLLIGGAAGCTASMVALALVGWMTASGGGGGGGTGGGGGGSGSGSTVLLLVGLCAFILSFSISWAGLYWVLVSELFSMGAKSSASSAATAMLFLTGECGVCSSVAGVAAVVDCVDASLPCSNERGLPPPLTECLMMFSYRGAM